MSNYKVAINRDVKDESFFKLYNLDPETFRKNIVEKRAIRTMFLQFYRSEAILDRKSGIYTMNDMNDMREEAINYGADFIVLLSPYDKDLGGKELLYCEDLREESSLSFSNDRVKIGILVEADRAYGFVTPYIQTHPMSSIFTPRFYRKIRKSEGRKYDSLKSYVDQFKRTGRFYTGILDDHPTFDFLYVAHKNGTALLIDRDGNETPIKY